MGLREVRKELALLEKEELLHHIAELYKKYKPVKEYFDFFANPDEDELLDKFKGRVREGFYPVRGWRLKLYRSRKAINEFKKLGISPKSECDLLLYFTEVAVAYAREKRVKTESYYERLENSLEKAMVHMHKHQLLNEFDLRINTLIERSEQFPWNCSNRLLAIKSQFTV
jgi:hypothetical protein